MLEAALTSDPDHEALVGSDRRVSYGELDRAADNAAAALVELGVGRRDVVAVSLPNTTEIVVLFHAVMRVGALFLGVNRGLAPPEKAFILDDAGARILLTDPVSGEPLTGHGHPGGHLLRGRARSMAAGSS